MSNRFDKKTIEDVNVKNKKVLLRCDLNVPIHDGKITDKQRILASIPTIKYLSDKGAKLVICSHLGKDKDRKDLSPVCKQLSKDLKKNITFLASENVVDDSVKNAIDNMKNGDIVMLQNTRWRAEESKNEETFSKELASICDIFVNDAFGTCHRAHCSTAGITKYVKESVAGYLIKAELDYLCNYIDNPNRPFITILGGSKIADKLKVIDRALDKSDTVIIGGGMAFTFLKALGYNVGKSLVDEEQIEYCKNMIKKSKVLGKDIVLPVDCVATKSIPEPIDNQKVATKTFKIENMDDDYMGLDVGPETIKLYLKYMSRAKTILWNGPVGLFENQKFALGTYSIAKYMSMLKGTTTIVGGGDSASAVNNFKFGKKMTHISTGGGATLDFLKGEPLPGIESLTDK